MTDSLRRTFYLPRNIPAFTGTVIFVCCLAFALFYLDPAGSPNWLGVWGDSNIWDIYNGRQIWSLLTSSLVHHEPLHLFFNLYWVWILGRVLEEEIGSLNMLFFWVAAALVSSAFQLALGEGTGIGASGVVYAIFGYEWAARHQVERFSNVLDAGRVRLFVIWLFVCLALSWSGSMNIGNAAHFSGFGFGYFLGYLVEIRKQAQLARQLAAMASLAALASAYYAPWSSWWCTAEGFRRANDNPVSAIGWFDRVSWKSDAYSYALQGRSDVKRNLGDRAGAMADLEEILTAGDANDNRDVLLNSLAWDYATIDDPGLRNGAKAVAYAKEACDLTDWEETHCLDTLAAAYATMGNFTDAVKWQDKAIEIEKKSTTSKDVAGMESRLELYQKKQPFIDKSGK